jgi:hypothetical protein
MFTRDCLPYFLGPPDGARKVVKPRVGVSVLSVSAITTTGDKGTYMSKNFLPATLASIFSHSEIQLMISLIKTDFCSLHWDLIFSKLNKPKLVQIKVDIPHELLGGLCKRVDLVVAKD